MRLKSKKYEVVVMSEMEINGIALNKLALTPQNLAFAEKLKRFHCAVVLDEPGCDQRSKAQLGIYEVLNKVRTPNILIVTTEKLMYSWYQSLIGNLGADFKFVSASGNGIAFFNPDLSNLLIMDARALSSAARPAVAQAIDSSDVVWDLLILDGGLTQSGFDSDYYSKNLHIKAKKLIIFAPIMQKSEDAAAKLAALPEKFLSEKPVEITLDETVTAFNPDTPVMKYEYETAEAFGCKFNVITYNITEQTARIYDEQAKKIGGTSGGNVFEELNVDKREIYVSPVYDEKMANELIEADPKLAAYIAKLEEITKNPENTLVTYFREEKTLEYIRKILAVRIKDFDNLVTVRKSTVLDIQSTMRRFGMAEESVRPRIILARDGISERFLRVGKITHVLSYELPDSPLILQQRYKRYGGTGFASPEFTVFSDNADRFDGRMLKSALAMNLLDGFCRGIPAANIYLSWVGLGDALAGVITELQSLTGLPDEEKTEQFTVNFCAKYRLYFSTFEQLHAFAVQRLADLRKAFNLGQSDDCGAIAEKIAKRLDEIRTGAVYLDGSGALAVTDIAFGNEKYTEFKNKISENAIIRCRAEAAVLLQKRSDELADENKFPCVADLIEKAPAALRSAVLYNSYWFFCGERGAVVSCRDYIREFNEGAM